jgi:hypothetical protein
MPPVILAPVSLVHCKSLLLGRFDTAVVVVVCIVVDVEMVVVVVGTVVGTVVVVATFVGCSMQPEIKTEIKTIDDKTRIETREGRAVFRIFYFLFLPLNKVPNS